MRKEIKKWAEERYTHGKRLETVFIPENITVDERVFEDAIVFGDDECFDCGEFYQYMLHGEELYQVYYKVVEDVVDLSNLDYTKPCRVQKMYDLNFILN